MLSFQIYLQEKICENMSFNVMKDNLMKSFKDSSN